MKLVKAGYEILTNLKALNALKDIEIAGRTCYKSEDKITEDSNLKFVQMLINRGHDSVLEHKSFTVRFIVDRGVSHEFVRHRLASFSQESTRYCNYGKDDNLNYIIPCWDNETQEGIYTNTDGTCHEVSGMQTKPIYNLWLWSCLHSEAAYNNMIANGAKPEQARSVLPNSLKTEIVITANLRQWREMFRQRTAKVAHPQMREVMRPLLDEVKVLLPIIFDDITYKE